jgi:hypothetical protein
MLVRRGVCGSSKPLGECPDIYRMFYEFYLLLPETSRMMAGVAGLNFLTVFVER